MKTIFALALFVASLLTPSVRTLGQSKCAGRFTSPSAKSELVLGQKTKISWVMPLRIDTYYNLDIYLLDAHGQRLGSVINWNWIKYNPTTSADWNTRTVYNDVHIGPQGGVQGNPPAYVRKPDQNTQLGPGKYKLRFSYEIPDFHTEAELRGCSRQGDFESDTFEIVRGKNPARAKGRHRSH